MRSNSTSVMCSTDSFRSRALPPPLRGGIENRIRRPRAPPGCRLAALHPWLHAVAPPGQKNGARRTRRRAQHSERMSLVRSRNTGPERAVRSLLHWLGYRFRLHGRTLPGSPDIVFARRKCVVFVHGCFWHRHACFNGRRVPKSRVAFWRAKLEGNAARDRRAGRRLRRDGWRVLVVWECPLRDARRLAARLRTFLASAFVQ